MKLPCISPCSRWKCKELRRRSISSIALADLKLDHAWIVYPGRQRYPVHERVDVLPLAEVGERLGFLAAGSTSIGGGARDAGN